MADELTDQDKAELYEAHLELRRRGHEPFKFSAPHEHRLLELFSAVLDRYDDRQGFQFEVVVRGIEQIINDAMRGGC